MKLKTILLLLFLFILNFQGVMAQSITLVTLGDSLTAGDGDEGSTSQGGFPPRLLNSLQTPYPGSTLNNLAVSGLTSDDLINIELTPAINTLNSAPATHLKIALIWIGSNNLFGLYNNVCDEYYPGDYPRCEEEELNNYRNNMDKIITDLKATGARLYIALLDDQSKRPVMTDAQLRNETFSAITEEEVTRMSAQVRHYNDAIQTLASLHGATTVDFYNTTIFEDWSTLNGDGNHPNSSGYDFIANHWYAAITGSSAATETVIVNPVPDIKVNHTVELNTQVAISLGLNSGDFSGKTADWWAVAISPTGILQSYIHPNQWTVAAELEQMTPAYQGELFDLALTPLMNFTPTEIGTYQLYFGVDLLPNLVLDMEPLFYDSASVQVQTTPPFNSSQLVSSNDFQYIGAFRLPDDGLRPKTFEYGGDAITYNPNGDAGSADGYPGSLFVMGHERLPYDELPDGNQVAEITIPVPIISKNPDELNQAGFIQNFQDIAKGHFTTLEELPTAGMQYLSRPETGPKIHLTWGQHNQDDAETMIASHAWFDPNLSAPNIQGPWFVGKEFSLSTNAFLFEIPANWADQYVGGRYLATGRFRDGGWAGQGPSLRAYKPWIDRAGTPAVAGSQLDETVLLQYASSENSDNVVEQSLNGYQHPDEWEGGAWITTSSGKSAVLFAGTKGTGNKYWYGYINSLGAEFPCVDSESVGNFTVCRMADGTACPPEDLNKCSTGITYRGWWSSHFDGQFILYDTAELAKVATGQINPWEPQPYTSIDIDEHLFLNSNGFELIMLGRGEQRRYRVGEITYDRINNRLFVLEWYADGAKPVVHVWKIQ